MMAICAIVFATENLFPKTGRFPPNGTVSGLINEADVVGLGRVIKQPSSTNNFVGIFVQDCWTGNITNDTILIKSYDSRNEVAFPANAPIVFFLKESEPFVTNKYSSILYTPEELEQYLSEPTLFFPEGDKAWFEATADNGILYDYTTNLWNCMQINPNLTNYFNVLIDGLQISANDSMRVHLDSFDSFVARVMFGPPEFLVAMHSRLDIPIKEHGILERGLEIFHRWTHTNGVWNPPSP